MNTESLPQYRHDVIKEGSAKFEGYVCKVGNQPTKKMPVFYNPKMAINRDLTILVLQALGKESHQPFVCCDALAGNGVRSIRMVKEIPSIVKIYANDLNPQAVQEIQRNVIANQCESYLEISNKDARILLRDNLDPRPNYIDIDPFGSPRLFIEPAFSAIAAKK